MNLPPGFRFYPTDEELVVHFLHRKATLLPCHPDVIPDLDLYPYDPWDLHGKALEEGNQWYFYSRKIQNRVTENGLWKTIGMEEPIVSSSSGRRVGVKKYLMFFLGGDVKTNWIMEEFRLPDSSSSSSGTGTSTGRSSRSTRSRSRPDYNKWVVCRVYERNSSDDDEDGSTGLSCLDEVFLSLDDLDDISLPYN
ncbi:NAC domain-containing protein 104 [Linum grandiflorum]